MHATLNKNYWVVLLSKIKPLNKRKTKPHIAFQTTKIGQCNKRVKKAKRHKLEKYNFTVMTQKNKQMRSNYTVTLSLTPNNSRTTQWFANLWLNVISTYGHFLAQIWIHVIILHSICNQSQHRTGNNITTELRAFLLQVRKHWDFPFVLMLTIASNTGQQYLPVFFGIQTQKEHVYK